MDVFLSFFACMKGMHVSFNDYFLRIYIYTYIYIYIITDGISSIKRGARAPFL